MNDFKFLEVERWKDGEKDKYEKKIEDLKKEKDALKETSFDINHFEVGETGAGGVMIEIDIRRKYENKK